MKHEKFKFLLDSKKKEYTCNNAFLDKKNGISYLQLILFKKTVLNYYLHDSDYILEQNKVTKIGDFTLFFSGVKENETLISVHLGDLACLSLEEQKYWKSYNVFK